MNKRSVLATGVALLAMTALAACGGSDSGGSGSGGDPDEKIKLKVADWLPVEHIVVKQGTEPWMDRITELTDGQVTFDYYPAEQIGPASDLFKLTLSGVTDIGFVNPAYVPEKLSLSSVAGLPGLAETSCQNSIAFWDLLQPGGVLYEQEFKAEGLHPLWVSATPAYEILTSKKAVTKPGDIKGMTLGLSGGAMARMAEELDAAPVSMSAPDRYDALRKGTINGTILGYATAPTYSLQEVVKYGTEGASLGSSASVYAISSKTWDSLPENVQEAMDQASEEITKSFCKVQDEAVVTSLQVMKDGGVQVHQLTDTEKQSFVDAVSQVAEDWVSKDLPAAKRQYGEQAIEDYKSAAEKVTD